MKMYFETQFSTVFDFEKMYNKYLEYRRGNEKEDQEIILSDFLDYSEDECKTHEEYEMLIALRENREKIYDLLTEERKRRERIYDLLTGESKKREGSQNLEK